jgi:hypothetical protein
MPNLIRCGDGSMSPAVFACRHMYEEATAEYVAVPDPDNEMDIYLCKACYFLGPEVSLTAENLQVVCMHCLRSRVAGMQEVPPGEF